MPISPLPAPLEQIGALPFSFHPPIRNLAGARFRFLRANWQEIVVVSIGDGVELCIPRSLIGDISIASDRSVVVSLNRELVWEEGEVTPRLDNVIELPVTVVGDAPEHADRNGSLAPVVSIRLEHSRPSPRRRKIAVACIVLFLILFSILREMQIRRRATGRRASAKITTLWSGSGASSGSR